MAKTKAKGPKVISVSAPIHKYRVRVNVTVGSLHPKVVAERTYIISASNEADALTEGKVRLLRESFEAARAHLEYLTGFLGSDARQIA